VNALDFNAVATNFGQSTIIGAPIIGSPALGTLVPEPASMGLILAAGAMTMSRRRRESK